MTHNWINTTNLTLRRIGVPKDVRKLIFDRLAHEVSALRVVKGGSMSLLFREVWYCFPGTRIFHGPEKQWYGPNSDEYPLKYECYWSFGRAIGVCKEYKKDGTFKCQF